MASILKYVCTRAVEIAIAQNRVKAKLTRLDDSEICFREAGLGEYQVETESLDGKQVRVVPSDMRDLIVWPDQLTDKPLAGELVEITFDNRTRRTFEVAAHPPEPCWRWTDRFETGIRIHMKEQ